eukprot:CAMPEP_0184665652 /NCGR_PEP_ID=MMETSP0308-20130426/58094_1 /TAXON_ID=38269 /ORGANISM="Gloeochaete witrockiana, Strain SAG 46.84" /LENGTH=70 /DNA_ID=CAMNT_0027109783 /DNA_START=38 /DNA_END=247 /DNA_ORIENTATION=-
MEVGSLGELNGQKSGEILGRLDACVAHFASVYDKMDAMNQLQEQARADQIKELHRYQDDTVALALSGVMW